MPRLGKRAQHFNMARDSSVKKSNLATSPDHSSSEQPSTSAAASQVEDAQVSSSDTELDSDEALTNDPEAMMEEFIADWVFSLPRDDLLFSFSKFLHKIFSSRLLQPRKLLQSM